MRFASFILAFATFLSTMPGFAAEYTLQKEMLQNLETISHVFHIEYAPAPWKAQSLNWDLDKAIDKAKSQITSTTTVSDFQKTIKQFFHSMRDYHVGVMFHSTEIAFMPFQLEKVSNRFFVAHVFRIMSRDLALPLNKGDEIISFEGVQMSTAFDTYLRSEGISHPNHTDISKAVQSFTQRGAALLNPMPENKQFITMEVRRKGTRQIDTVEIPYIYMPENIPVRRGIDPWVLNKGHIAEKVLTKDKMSVYSADVQNKIKHQAIVKALNNHGLTSPKNLQTAPEDQEQALIELVRETEGTRIPALGEIIYESPINNYFQAYIYRLETGEKVGFIRINTYMPFQTANFFWLHSLIEEKSKLPWEEFADLIAKFEHETDALVIDQNDNSGGSFLYMLALLRHLSDKPMELPKNYLTLTSDDIQSAVMIGKENEAAEIAESEKEKNDFFFMNVFGSDYLNGTIHGYPADSKFREQFTSFYAHMLEQWNNGITYIDPIPLENIVALEPDPIHYTKPLVVLANELDFSCADFFPSILQDNKRAVIFGKKTAGAGGAVRSQNYANRMNIGMFSMTTTLALRTNSQPVENVGVLPDVPYNVGLVDVLNNYERYVKTLNNTIHSLVK